MRKFIIFFAAFILLTGSFAHAASLTTKDNGAILIDESKTETKTGNNLEKEKIKRQKQELKEEARAQKDLAKEQAKALEKQAKADTKTQKEQIKAQKVNIKAQEEQIKANEKQAKADAKLKQKQLQAEAKADAKAQKEQAKALEKQAKLNAKAEKEQAKAEAAAQKEQLKVQTKTDTGAQGKEINAKASTGQEKADGTNQNDVKAAKNIENRPDESFKTPSGEEKPVVLKERAKTAVRNENIIKADEKMPAADENIAAPLPDGKTADSIKQADVTPVSDVKPAQVTDPKIYRQNLTYADIDKNAVSINEFLNFTNTQNEKFSVFYYKTTSKLNTYAKQIKDKETQIKAVKKLDLSEKNRYDKLKKLNSETEFLMQERDDYYNSSLKKFNSMLTKKQAAKWEILQQMGYRFFPEFED